MFRVSNLPSSFHPLPLRKFKIFTAFSCSLVLSGPALVLPRKQTMFVELQVRQLGVDHISAGCGGPTLMLANLYRLSNELCAYCGRGVNLVINKK